MKLNPDDIMNQNFSSRPMGFNKEEVRAFLEIVATEFDDLINENARLKKNMDEKDTQSKLMDETRAQVKEILSVLQLIRGNDQEQGVYSINRIASSLGEILETMRGFKEKITAIQPSKAEYTTKEDLERFVSTIHKLKEEELDKAGYEAARVVEEAHQKAEELLRQAEADLEGKKEEAALIVNNAQQRAEEIIKEAESLAEARREQAVLLTNEARQRVEAMITEAKAQSEAKRQESQAIISEAQEKSKEIIKEAENQAGKMREEGSQIIKDAQNRARSLVKEAEDQVEGKKEEAALIIREAQQKAGTIIRDARGEEENIKQSILDLKKQHRLFEHRIKEIIDFHLSLLGSISDESKEDNNSGATSSPGAKSPFTAPNQSPFEVPKNLSSTVKKD